MIRFYTSRIREVTPLVGFDGKPIVSRMKRFQPYVCGLAPMWNMFNLRKDRTVADGRCIVGADSVEPISKDGIILLAENPHEKSQNLKKVLNSSLGISLPQDTLASYMEELLKHEAVNHSWLIDRGAMLRRLVIGGVLIYGPPKLIRVPGTWQEAFTGTGAGLQGSSAPFLSWVYDFNGTQPTWSRDNNIGDLAWGYSANTDVWAIVDDNLTSPDHYAQLVYKAGVPGTNTHCLCGVFVRGDGSAGEGLCGYFNFGATAAAEGNWVVSVWANGSYVDDLFGSSSSLSANDVIKLTVEDAAMNWELFKNGGSLGSGSDTTNLDANVKVGIAGAYNSMGGSFNFDDFEASELVPPATNYQDIATRFKLTVQSYQDITTRFKLTAQNYKDIATRFRLTVQGYLDIATRFKLQVQGYKDIATRFLLMAGTLAYKDIATRFTLTVRNYLDVTNRFRLIAQSYQDVATRFRLTVQNYQDIPTRFKLTVRSYKDVSTRFLLTVGTLAYEDIATRFRLTVQNYQDIATRFRLRVQAYKDISIRFKLWVQNYQDIATRFLLRVQGYKDITTRFVLHAQGYRDTTTRFVLAGLGFSDIATRFRLHVGGHSDVSTKFRLRLAAAFPVIGGGHIINIVSD